MDDALKTRGIKYLNVDTGLLLSLLFKFLATRLVSPCLKTIEKNW